MVCKRKPPGESWTVGIESTSEFLRWFEGLKDRGARWRIQARIDRLEAGNPGRHRVLKGGVFEMKIDYGPGYRVYYMRRGEMLVILLCGGDKARQQQDIQRAIAMTKRLGK